MYNHACVFCRQSANGNLNVEGIAMYYVQENTIATTMYNECSQLLFTVFHQNTSFIHGAAGQERTQDINHHPLNCLQSRSLSIGC